MLGDTGHAKLGAWSTQAAGLLIQVDALLKELGDGCFEARHPKIFIEARNDCSERGNHT